MHIKYIYICVLLLFFFNTYNFFFLRIYVYTNKMNIIYREEREK